MTDSLPKHDETPPSAPGEAPEDEGRVSIFTEFFWFIRDNKKWWLIPLVAIILLLAVIIFLGSNPATAPFIYTLF